MRLLIIPALLLFMAWCVGSCGSSSNAPTFCDTTCSNDTFKFNLEHPDNPFVNLSVKDCKPDTLVWSHDGLSTNRKSGFVELIGRSGESVRLNKNFISCTFKDTSYAWLRFNDCITGRGYLVKLPYSKTDRWSIYTSALNNFDKKFNVEEGLIAYYDDTFIYVQDIQTGKTEKMVLSDKKLDIDHNNVHSTFDSINVSRTKIWANITVNGTTGSKEKSISLN